MKRMHLLLLSVLSLLNCSGDEKSATPLPANLVVDIQVDTEGGGTVKVNASAENTAYYYIFFNEEPNEVPAVSYDGTAEHTYLNSGTYKILVEAHASASKYITKSVFAEVAIDETFTIPSTGYETPLSYDGMQLVWNDEFDGTSLNETDWTFEIGTGSNGWGNNELQYYRKENTTFQDGKLIITARKENYASSQYTSSRIKTQDKKIFQYGRVDIRAVLPRGQGIWPALWMLGNNISSVGWPSCGEIDIMELVGGSSGDNTTYGTAHWNDNGHACNCDGNHSYTLGSGIFADEFHVFSIVWTATTITWYVDDQQFATIDISDDVKSELKGEAFFLFNVAVGGDWPGSPNSSTVFPQRMMVDYIRVFQPL